MNAKLLRRTAPPILLFPAILGGLLQQPPAAQNSAAIDPSARPLLVTYCAACHGAARPAAGIDLSNPVKSPVRLATLRRVLSQIRAKSMPPVDAKQPTVAERNLLIAAIAAVTEVSDGRPDPGRVLIHRLSRTEYNNTIRDLLGVNTRPADQFPADGGGGGGFDNDADTLFVPPILMEKYLEAAGAIVNAANPRRIFTVLPVRGIDARQAAARDIARMAGLAYRRPVSAVDLHRLMGLYDLARKRHADFGSAVKVAVKAILVSPEFLYRIEPDHAGTAPYPLDDYELASRLSYFLWSSMPDAELSRLAASDRLHTPLILAAQVRRMIADPRTSALAESFAPQWLRIRDLYSSTQPDTAEYQAYTPSLRDAMYQETIRFFDSVIREDGNLMQLIDCDYTYLNESLASLYGISGVKGPEFRRVHLPDDRRGGLLTMASVLTLTSFPQRTSPVLRGKWVLSQILGTPPPPPLPNAGGLPPDGGPLEGLTFRQRLEKHRSKPECASCHARMDPLGFGLENFDVIGRWRSDIGGKPVDASGVLTTGEKFTGPVELKHLLLNQKDQFLRNLTERMLSYALGRGIESGDEPAVKSIVAAVEMNGCRSGTLIGQIAASLPFRYRRNERTAAVGGPSGG